MANRKNITTKKEKSKASKTRNSKGNDSAREARLGQDAALVFALVVVLVSCLTRSPLALSSTFSAVLTSSFGAILVTPSLPFLLVPVFCCLALYLLLTKRSIGRFATISTLIFTAVALCFIVGGILGAGRRCGGFDCSSASALYFYALFLYDPFTNLLWNVLSVTGIVLLVRRLKRASH